jgi:hypothetical protein
MVVGSWKRTLGGKSVDVKISTFRTLTAREASALDRERTRYAAFVNQR